MPISYDIKVDKMKSPENVKKHYRLFYPNKLEVSPFVD